jgi:hypothetical protein
VLDFLFRFMRSFVVIPQRIEGHSSWSFYRIAAVNMGATLAVDIVFFVKLQSRGGPLDVDSSSGRNRHRRAGPSRARIDRTYPALGSPELPTVKGTAHEPAAKPAMKPRARDALNAAIARAADGSKTSGSSVEFAVTREKFAATAKRFAVTLKKFPVPLRRESRAIMHLTKHGDGCRKIFF